MQFYEFYTVYYFPVYWFTGWAAAFIFNANLRAQLAQFYDRKDTFSLGVCNGCQLMVRLGLIGSDTQLQSTTGNKWDAVMQQILTLTFCIRWF